MEFRKELMRRQLYQSDIFNIKTGYYKNEKILPITPKPTETVGEIKEFIPKYRNIYANLRLNNDILGKRLNKSYTQNNLIFSLKRNNSEVQIFRKYNKTIRDNCFDEKGNFSAKKRFRLEFYGKDGRDNVFRNQTFFCENKKSIKDKRKPSLRKKSKNSFNKLDFDENSQYKSFNRINSCKNIYKYQNSPNSNKDNDSNNKKNGNSVKKQKENNKINNKNYPNQGDIIKSINKTNSLAKLKCKNNKGKSLTKGHLNINTITNKLNDKRNKKNNKEAVQNDDFYIEIKNENDDTRKNNIIVDKKKLKQIFLKNGLHIYNFNENETNILSSNKNFEAKLRKNKEDQNFDKNYRNVVRELNKINIKVTRRGMVFDNCIINKNTKIRKGTPGKNLKKNIKNLNYGIKRDRYVLPISNKEYKNGYKYNLNFFNHNKLNLK